MSQDIGIGPNLRVRPFVRLGWVAGLVVAGGVEGELAEQVAGVFVDHADVAVLDQEQDGGSGGGSSDANVVQPTLVAQGDHTGGVDAVAADRVSGCADGELGAGAAFGRAR